MDESTRKEKFLEAFRRLMKEKKAIAECQLTYYLIRQWYAKDPGFQKRYAEIRAYILTVRRCVYCTRVAPKAEFRSDPRETTHRIAGICKKCESRRIVRKGCKDVETKLRSLWKGTKARPRAGGRNYSPGNLTFEELKEQYERQQGLCYYTGLPMTLARDQNNWSVMSIDRVDPKVGYQANNVVLCRWIVNRAKGDMSVTEFKTLCQQVSNQTSSLQ